MAAPELSTRQRALLDGIANGHTNRDIGRHLGIKEYVVSHDLSILYGKLGAKDRAHAVHLAHLCGLLGGAA